MQCSFAKPDLEIRDSDVEASANRDMYSQGRNVDVAAEYRMPVNWSRSPVATNLVIPSPQLQARRAFIQKSREFVHRESNYKIINVQGQSEITSQYCSISMGEDNQLIMY